MKHLMVLAASILGSFTAQADPIFISSGQCIYVGSQQICALKSKEDSHEGKRTIHMCQYGKFENSEMKDLNTHALVEVTYFDNGRKIEIPIKNFGLFGKQDCEKELSSLHSK